MGTTSFPQTPLNTDLERVIVNLNTMAEELDHVFGGKIDTKNIREIAGWIASRYKLQSKDGDVGFNTEDTGADDIRIWAGDNLSGSPKFTVTKGGILTAIAALFASSNGYPRVEMNSATGSIGAYQAADNYLKIEPDAYGSTPGIAMHNSIADALIYLLGASLTIQTPAGQSEIQISSGKNLDLFCNAGSGYKTRVDSWAAMYSLYDGKTLRQELDTLQSQITVVQAQSNGHGINISTLFSDVSNLYDYCDYLNSYCNSLDARITALGG